MNRYQWLGWVAGVSILLVSAALAATSEWVFAYRPASTRYAVYGGSLGDPVPPTAADRKIAFEVTGRAARDLFEAIGPDIANACTGKDTRLRWRDDGRLACTRSAKGEYACHFGFDLATGRSIGGSIC